jgi:hypothetical protein
VNRTATANGPAAPAAEAQAESGLLDRVVEATQQARQFSLEEVRYMAEATAKSDMYGLSQSQAFVLMMIAESERLHPVQALRRFHIVEGKPSMRADAMQAEFQRHGGRLRWVKSSAEECEAEFWHPVYHPDVFTVRVTLKELIDSEVAMQWPKRKEGQPQVQGKVLKNTYKQFPRQMLRARVISEGVRAIDPGVVVGIYTPEEVSDFDDRPSTRPLPADAPASHQEPVATTSESVAPQPTPSSDCGRWIQTRVDEANAEWSMMCVQAKKPYKKLCNRFQCVNGIVTSWLESDPPRLYPEAVEIDGKRDNAKVADVLKEMWESEERDIVKFDVNSYLDLKLEEATRAAGINMDAQPPEEALSNG